MRELKCDTCRNSRPIISENGLHYNCVLSGRKSLLCMSDDRYYEHIIRPEDIAKNKAFKDAIRKVVAEYEGNA